MPISVVGQPFISKEERDELRNLCDVSTAGPWKVTELDNSKLSVRGVPNDDYYDIWPVCQIVSETIWGKQDDLFLMAAAREAIPKLLAEITRLERELGRR